MSSVYIVGALCVSYHTAGLGGSSVDCFLVPARHLVIPADVWKPPGGYPVLVYLSSTTGVADVPSTSSVTDSNLSQKT